MSARKSPTERRATHAAAHRRNRERRLAWLRDYKSRLGCCDCGEQDWRCLDLDHTDGKSRPIEKLQSIAAIQLEIANHRCVVRCANCHRKRTYEEQLGKPAREARLLEAT